MAVYAVKHLVFEGKAVWRSKSVDDHGRAGKRGIAGNAVNRNDESRDVTGFFG